jgi:uroporphyrinogen-III decarboxylase
MTDRLSVRDRLLTALACDQPDRVPCTFMIFVILRRQCATEEQFVKRQLGLGLDPFVHLGHLPMIFHESVSTHLVKQPNPDGREDLLVKTYSTPAGELEAIVRQTEDWEHGDELPLLDDFVIPRSKKFPVAGKDDLPALRYLFADFREEDITAYRQRAVELTAFARQNSLPTVAGWGRGGEPGVMGMDAAMWLVGMENLMLLAHYEPETVEELADIIGSWNRKQMAIMLDETPDLLIRRAWYETTEFWSPAMYERFIQPGLKAEVDLAHQAGTRFGYIITSAMMALVPNILAAGVDVIIGIDPIQGKGTDLPAIKQATAGKTALWGGVSGSMTVELGTAEQTRQAVRQAIDVLAPDGGFILSPVDNVRDETPQAWPNVRALIDACHEFGHYS